MTERTPFALLRHLSSDLDRMFDDWSSLPRPPMARLSAPEPAPWFPKVDVFQRDNHLITRVDLPGVKKENVTVEVAAGQLTLSGERKRETSEQKDQMFRSEREYGSFFRTVPLPEGVRAEDIKATFAEGVLEVSMPLPARLNTEPQRVQIDEPPKPIKTAAA
jgi:HSP20 family protein